MALVLILLGSGLLIAAAAFLYTDCVRGYGFTMGGEMTFSGIWSVGALALAAGICFALDMHIAWAVAVWVAIYVSSFAVRKLVEKVGMRYGPRG